MVIQREGKLTRECRCMSDIVQGRRISKGDVLDPNIKPQSGIWTKHRDIHNNTNYHNRIIRFLGVAKSNFTDRQEHLHADNMCWRETREGKSRAWKISTVLKKNCIPSYKNKKYKSSTLKVNETLKGNKNRFAHYN